MKLNSKKKKKNLNDQHFNLIRVTSNNMTNFIQFLLDKNIKLPLSSYKSELAPLHLLNYHNDTVNKAFVIENSHSMYDMNEMRADFFSDDELFHRNMTAIRLQPASIQTM